MNNKRIKRTFLLAIFFSCTLLSFPSHSSALTISPPRLEVRGDKGQILKENITLTNDKNVSQEFYLSLANFEAQGETGNPSFVNPKDDLGTWISAPENVIFLPGESKVVPIIITIPKDAEPGGHFAAVFWGTTPNNATGSSQVSLGAKVGTLVLLSVNGEVKEDAGLLSFNTENNKFWYKTLPVSFEFRFKNDGGDRVKPTGPITLRDTIFLKVDSIPANVSEGNVLPGSTRKFTSTWQKFERDSNYIAPEGGFAKFWSSVSYEWKNFAVGLYSANLNIEYGLQKQHVKKMAFFFVFPWELIIVILIIGAIAYFGGRKGVKKYNKYIIEKAKIGMGV